MNGKFRVDQDGTLVEYLGEPKSFTVLRDSHIVAKINSYYKESIQTVRVPGESVRKIGFKAFKNCSIQTLRLEAGVRAVELGAFSDCEVRTVWIPHSIRYFSVDGLSIGKKKVTLCVDYIRGAWRELEKAGFILKKIPQGWWEKYSGLFIALKLAYHRVVTLNIHVQGDLADKEFLGMPIDCIATFHSNTQGKFLFQKSMPSTVVIEKGVSTIDDDAFRSSGDAYFENPSIENINVVPGNQCFYSKDGVLFDSTHTLLRYPQGKGATKYRIPEDTTMVAAGAFDGCYALETLVVPEGVILMEDALVNTPRLNEVWKEERRET